MKHTLSPVCVYCGSSSGRGHRFSQAAASLGTAMAQRGVDLVYGGGRAGLMGSVADSVLAGGGHVLGIITRQLLDMETAHTALPDLRIVDTMHQRKLAMIQHARGFIALPGGVGTLDELFEVLAWAQLGLHHHPIGILNVDGFYDTLLNFIAELRQHGFLRIDPDNVIALSADPGELLDIMASRVTPPQP
jgi:uncharacterized protein (TIGR00730 family)